MTDAMQPRERSATALFHVRRSLDVREIDALLQDDPAYAAYALGHLEPGLFERAEFWIAEPEHGSGFDLGLVMHARAALGRTTVLAGEPAALDAALRLHPGPRSAYLATCAPSHIPVIERTHALTGVLRMQRMEVTAGSFSPAPAAAARALPLRRLRGWDAGPINALYATGDGPSGYRAADIERAVYYGIHDGQRLVAVAGTHVVAPHSGVAVVGNVFTREGYRGRGLATRVTGAVTAELLQQGLMTVALTVDPHNTPAVAAYRRLGYRPGVEVVEARAYRRDALGALGWWRRLTARRRGAGEEIAPGRAP